MNYEEKYNEALERAKKFEEKYGGDYAGYIFPELAESEDERIRKWLVNYFKEVGKSWIHRDINPEQIIAYLEKQKEQKPADNPKWAELTWKDINELERIINNVHYEFQNGIGEDSFGELVLERFREYKDDGSMDEQKPAEWSEEDERIRKAILGFVNPDKGGTKYSSYAELVKWSDWLKSLRPSWKPSKEQMEALNVLNLHGALSYVGQQNQLISLYQDLKKRM